MHFNNYSLLTPIPGVSWRPPVSGVFRSFPGNPTVPFSVEGWIEAAFFFYFIIIIITF